MLQQQPQQCRSQATSATYTTAHGNAGSLTHWMSPGIEPASLWMLVRLISARPLWGLLKYLLVPCDWGQVCLWKVGFSWNMVLGDGCAGICQLSRAVQWVRTWVSASGLHLPGLLTWSSKPVEKAQKNEWDEFITSSVIFLAATGMFWKLIFFP